MRIGYGDIVLVRDLLDPKGRNPKTRPAVVVTKSSEVASGSPILIVPVSTTLPGPLPETFVPIPWSRPRHARAGLNERNAAIRDWLTSIDEARIIRPIGRAPDQVMASIDRTLRRLAGETP